jgi:hypothetical protein
MRLSVAAVEHVRAQSRPRRLACDLFVAITASFRVISVFVVLEVGSRRSNEYKRLSD